MKVQKLQFLLSMRSISNTNSVISTKHVTCVCFSETTALKVVKLIWILH